MEAEFYGSIYSGTKYRYIDAAFCVGGAKNYIKPLTVQPPTGPVPHHRSSVRAKCN